MRKITKQNKNNLFFTVFLLSVGTFYPFVHNYVIFGGWKTLFAFLFLSLWAVFIQIFNIKLKLPSRNFNLMVLIQLIYFIAYSLYWQSSDIYSVIFYLILSWIFLTFIISTFTIEDFFKYFIRFNIVSGIFCLIGTILFSLGYLYLVGVHSYQGNFSIYNFGWFFLKRSTEFEHQLRPAGYYDEPGSFAFVTMFLLLINRKYFKNIKWEYALMFLPMLTTSMAHIFTVLIFIALFYVNKKNFKYAIMGLGILISIVFVITSDILPEESTRYIRQRTVERVTGFLAGERDASRQGGIELGPQIFSKYSWGRSKELVMKEYPDFVNETIWGPLIYYGVIFFPIYMLPFIYIFVKSLVQRDFFDILCIVLISVNLLQRPYYMYPLWIVLIYYLFFYERDSQNKIISIS